jgi:hypothetical protein
MMVPFTAQPLIDRMIETQHDPREYARLRPFYTGLSRDDFLYYDGDLGYVEAPSRISRLIAFVGAATRIRPLRENAENASSSCEVAA